MTIIVIGVAESIVARATQRQGAGRRGAKREPRADPRPVPGAGTWYPVPGARCPHFLVPSSAGAASAPPAWTFSPPWIPTGVSIARRSTPRLRETSRCPIKEPRLPSPKDDFYDTPFDQSFVRLQHVGAVCDLWSVPIRPSSVRRLRQTFS